MKKFVALSLAVAFVLSLVGCNDAAKNSASANTSNNTSDGGKLADSYSTSNTPDSNNAPATKPEKPKDPGIDLAKLPAGLKSDAFEYYGLGRVDPITMTMDGDGKTRNATQTVKLTKVDKDSAEFTVTNEGGFENIGDVVLKLDKEGIKVVTMRGNKAELDMFELPNGLAKGKSWPTKMDLNGSSFIGTNKVAGTESVTTPVGTYKDALVILSTASGKQAGQKITSTIKLWLVKGRGQVKAEVTNVTGKKTDKITVIESK